MVSTYGSYFITAEAQSTQSYFKEALINSSMNYQSTKKGNAISPFFHFQ